MGKYCLQAASSATNCPAGKYNPYTGAKSASDCLWCPPGSYCQAGASAPTGPCALGYWCGNGSTNATANPCPADTYRNVTGATAQSDCSLCPSGSYCPIATSNPLTCPAGSYCLTGTSNPAPCVVGTFSNTTGVRRVDDCSPCSPGMYCASAGLTAPTGYCAAGYYCLAGSNTSAPAPPGDPFSTAALAIGGRCPAGGYW